MSFINQFLRSFARVVDSMEREHWVLASVAVVVVGLICMRGYGSRTNY